MERRKLTKEDIDKVRNIEGFPNAKDEDIIALSDAPYYTACPNPFIGDFIKENGTPYDEATDDYQCEPFAADVSVGKNDPTYLAHSYHTKVPYKAIMRYLMHYTKPGDLVLDGFCGTGMTGLAALMCGNPDLETKHAIEQVNKDVKWGKRFAILNDLSPAATFISENYNTPVNKLEFHRVANKIIKSAREECSWLYKTKHITTNRTLGFDRDNEYGDINYVIWSDVFICPHCGESIVFWQEAIDNSTGKVKDSFTCKHCGVRIKKKDCLHAKETVIDKHTCDMRELSKQIPVQICYSYHGKKYIKVPDEYDTELLEKINSYDIESWYPTDKLPDGDNTAQPRQSHGVTFVYDFLYKRALIVLSALRKYCPSSKYYWLITSILEGSSKLNRERPNGLPSKLNGTLYISSMVREINVLDFFERKIKRYLEANIVDASNIISTGSCTDLRIIPPNCIDYIFTDPPFGSNINYSELSFAWEAWLAVKTNNKEEAIINNSQRKQLSDYQELMEKCFCEYYRVLKPNRWMTVEFHNSKNSVWNAIQEALLKAGFIIADVRTLDKKQGSFKQVTTTTAVKQDLVISAYKPKDNLKKKLYEQAGSEETAWEFVKQHLENIPVVVVKEGNIEIISERQAFLLFDRMVAYHIVNSIPVPIDATDFYKGLDERFLKRDGMYFLPDQVNEYDTARIINDIEPIQFSLVVSNEKAAIAWLYKELDTPQTFSDIQPKFMQEIKGVTIDKYETIPELSILLAENFLQDDNGKWYVPDVTKEADIVKLREKNLLKEFEGYLATKGKLKTFRSEAIRVGFAKLWKDKNYKLIVETAERLPEQIVQEDDKLLMYYDISLGRV